MEEIYIHEFEFASDYFEPIKQIVRENNPLIGTVDLNDIYSLEDYMASSDETKLNVLLDNNIFTRIVYLAKGGEITGNSEEIKTYKFCCATMCFFILGGFNIEPNIALYEKASRNTHSSAVDAISYFRLADHIHPMSYAELALGVKNKFDKIEIETAQKLISYNHLEIKETNFKRLLDDWKIIYLHLLKIYELKITQIQDTEKIRTFLTWVVEDCFSNPASTIFAFIFFSPNSSSFGSMIKKVNSSDINKIKHGLENAAWDLTYITRYRKLSKVQEENAIWFFCSHDKVLQKIVRNLTLKREDDRQTALNTLAEEFWGRGKYKEVLGYYDQMATSITENNERRIQHNRSIRSRLDSMIKEQEFKIFS